jgi:predicted amidohydrolase YtcJ
MAWHGAMIEPAGFAMKSHPHRLRSPRAGSAWPERATATAASRGRTAAVLLVLGCASWACRQVPAQHPGDLVQAADVVLTGAVVYTMEPARPRAEAIAIRAGRIVHVGSDETVQPFIAAETRVEDLGGQTVLPGLHDSHTHLIWSGAELEDVSLSEATTMEELQAAIAARAAEKPDAPWIRGGGWDVSLFEGKLHKSQLDELVPDRPVYMSSVDGHSAWVNSAALAAAGITATTPDPPGGRIERDAGGEPSGVLRESAMALVSKLIPPYSEEQVDEGLARAQAEAGSYGITSIVEASTQPWMLAGYQRFADRGALTVRVHAAVKIDPAKGARQIQDILALRRRYGAGLVQVNAVKLFLDGVIESKTAYMIEPYTGGINGIPNFTDTALADIVLASDDAGLQLHAHVIGDGAVRQMLNALDALVAARGAADRRPVLAHLEVIDPADLPRFGVHGVHAAFSPLWAYPDRYITELTVPVIGPACSEWLYPIASVKQAGGVLVAGSDWNVSSMDPFDGIEVAITRQAPEGETGPALTPQQRVTLQDMLEAYTINGARASFVEAELGSITEGKRADLVVLDRDPFAIQAAELSEVRVLRTLLDGREVYRATPARARGATAQ